MTESKPIKLDKHVHVKHTGSQRSSSIQNKQGSMENAFHRKSKRFPVSNNGNPFDIPVNLRVFSSKRNIKKSKPDGTFLMSDPKTICDIDSTFYKAIEGRPLRQFIDVKVYMRNIRDITLLRANAAYLKEQVIQIHTSIVDDRRTNNEVYKIYVKTKSNFIKFVKESYGIAKSVQQKAELKFLELNGMIEQLSALSFTYVTLRNKVDSLVVFFEVLSKYGNFLNSLSPHWWRTIYDKDFEDNNFLFAYIFADKGPPSDLLIHMYKTSESTLKKSSPKLYFKKPIQLVRIFDNVSKQCLNYMQIEYYSSKILIPVLKSCSQLQIKVLAEIFEVKDFILFYERETNWMEEKEMEYKTKFYRILYAEFQKLYASFESTHLYTCVQHVHTQLFGGPEDPKDDIKNLAFNIENLYTYLTSKLDSLNQDLVNEVTRELFAEDINKMKRAHKAQRSLREYNILKKCLTTSFELPRYKHKKANGLLRK